MHGHHRQHGRGGRGFRAIPNREQQVERLRGYRAHLESELKNVDELLERLADTPAAEPAATPSA